MEDETRERAPFGVFPVEDTWESTGEEERKILPGRQAAWESTSAKRYILGFQRTSEKKEKSSKNSIYPFWVLVNFCSRGDQREREPDFLIYLFSFSFFSLF